MTWFKLTDQFHSNPKVLKAGNAPIGLWVRCATYSANWELDGRVPMEIAHQYGIRSDIDVLTSVRLWIPRDGDYVIPDFLEFNPSHKEIELNREREAAKKRRQRSAGTASVARDSNGQYMSRDMSPGDYPRDYPGESL